MTQSYTLTEEGTTIFTMGDWGINTVDRGEYAFIKIDTLIVHNCRNNPPGSGFDRLPNPLIIIREIHLSSPCEYCKETCPPEIQALWRLQNMEKL